MKAPESKRQYQISLTVAFKRSRMVSSRCSYSCAPNLKLSWLRDLAKCLTMVLAQYLAIA